MGAVCSHEITHKSEKHYWSNNTHLCSFITTVWTFYLVTSLLVHIWSLEDYLKVFAFCWIFKMMSKKKVINNNNKDTFFQFLVFGFCPGCSNFIVKSDWGCPVLLVLIVHFPAQASSLYQDCVTTWVKLIWCHLYSWTLLDSINLNWSHVTQKFKLSYNSGYQTAG